jgi:hypothetical protein
MLGFVLIAALPASAADGKGKKRPGIAGKGRDAMANPQAMMMQLMRRYDANKNGRLEADEQRALMAALDANLDGRVSPEELMAAAQGGGEGARKEGAKKKKEK